MSQTGSKKVKPTVKGSRATRKASSSGAICQLILGGKYSGAEEVGHILGILGAELPRSGNSKEIDEFGAFHNEFFATADNAPDDSRLIETSKLPTKERTRLKNEIGKLIKSTFKRTGLFVLNEARLSRVASLYFQVLRKEKIAVRAVVTFRDPFDVCRMLDARDGIERTEGGLIWLREVLNAEFSSRRQVRTIMCCDNLLYSWSEKFKELSERCGLELSFADQGKKKEIDDFLSKTDTARTNSPRELSAEPLCSDALNIAFEALQSLAADPNSRSAKKQLDELRAALDDETSSLSQLINKREDNSTLPQTSEAEEVPNRQLEEISFALLKKSEELKDARKEVGRLRAALHRKTVEAETASRQLQAAQAETVDTKAWLLEVANEQFTMKTAFELERQEIQEKLKLGDQLVQQSTNKLANVADQLEAAEFNNFNLKRKIERYENSASWKVTRPSRMLFKKLSAMRGDEKRKLKEQMELISQSGLFDEDYYRTKYQDLSRQLCPDALLHFAQYGGVEGRSPSAQFDSRWYLDQYDDVRASAMNPLVHYLKFGKIEGRKPRQSDSKS